MKRVKTLRTCTVLAATLCGLFAAGTAMSAGAAGAEERAGITLNGRFIPKEKFLVYVVMGDSNTDGGGFHWYDTSWTSDRIWRLDPKSRQWELWLPPGPPNPKARRRRCVALALGRLLAERYPEYHFGFVESHRGGSQYVDRGRYQRVQSLVDPYVKQVSLQGCIVESYRNPMEAVAEAARHFGIPAEKVPVIASQIRHQRTCRLTTPIGLEKRFLADLTAISGEREAERWLNAASSGAKCMADVDGLYARFPMVDTISVDGLFLMDWCHSLRHDVWAERIAHKLVARGWATPTAKPDATPPTAPRNFRLVKVWDTGAKVAWEAASDDLAVEGYELLCNGEKVPFLPMLSPKLKLVTTVQLEFPVTGLEPGKEYALQVRARDYAHNVSPPSPILKVTTTTRRPAVTKFPFKINFGSGPVGDWVADKEFRDGEDYGRIIYSGGRLLRHSGWNRRRDQWEERYRPKELAAIFGEGAPEVEVFSNLRGFQLFYRVRVPDGHYRVTWYNQEPGWLNFVPFKDRRGKEQAGIGKDLRLVGWEQRADFGPVPKLAQFRIERQEAPPETFLPLTRIYHVPDGELALGWPAMTYDRAIVRTAALVIEQATAKDFAEQEARVRERRARSKAAVEQAQEMAKYGKDDVIAVISGTLTRRTPTRAAKDLAPYIHAFFTSEVAVTEVKKGRVPGNAKSVIVVSYGWKDRKRAEAADWKVGQKLDDLTLRSWEAQPKALKGQIMDDELIDLSRPWFFVDREREMLDLMKEEGTHGIDDEDALDLP